MEHKFASNKAPVNNYPVSQSSSTMQKQSNSSITPINTHNMTNQINNENTSSPFTVPNIPPISSFGFGSGSSNTNTNTISHAGKNYNLTFTIQTGGAANTENQRLHNDNQDKFLAQFNSGAQNKSFEQGEKGLSVVVPDVPKSDSVYPGLESVQKHSSNNNTFVFDNIELPSHGNHTAPFDHQPKQDIGFDFGFPDVKTDPFNPSKQDDIFKTTNKFEKDPDWDF
jgi:hypothetical protein